MSTVVDVLFQSEERHDDGTRLQWIHGVDRDKAFALIRKQTAHEGVRVVRITKPKRQKEKEHMAREEEDSRDSSGAPPKEEKASIAATTAKMIKLIDPLPEHQRGRVLEALNTLYGA